MSGSESSVNQFILMDMLRKWMADLLWFLRQGKKFHCAFVIWNGLSPLKTCYNVKTREGALTNKFLCHEKWPLPEMVTEDSLSDELRFRGLAMLSG